MLTPWRRFLEVIFTSTLTGLQAPLRHVSIAVVCDINAVISSCMPNTLHHAPDTLHHATLHHAHDAKCQVCIMLGTAMKKK
jgi:hypothetical protein